MIRNERKRGITALRGDELDEQEMKKVDGLKQQRASASRGT